MIQTPASIRVAAVQFRTRRIAQVEEFEQRVAYWIGVAADYRADFVTLPELFTMEIASAGERMLSPAEAMERVAGYTGRFCAFMQDLAVKHRINIIGGSHPGRMEDGTLRNICHVFLRDGSVHARDKLHPTPSEREVWGITGGNRAGVIASDCGPIGVMICYDSEFPELARHLVDQGALVLFVPYCTDDRRGHLRVRHCCHARTVENQCHVVTAGLVGNLANVANMDVHHAQSAVLTPSDLPFARDGVAAEAEPNAEAIVVADLSLADLAQARIAGSVRNLADRRHDLYRVEWLGPDGD
jgi:predicted amidohydrolase